jgi:lipopolysaccharide/colanic/teichoic acid biosynthesis glycosyltransferase
MTSNQAVKRIIDIVLASVILVLTLPFHVLAILLLLIFEGRPLFYVSRRMVGTNRSLPILKYRTMVRDAKSPRYRLNERFMRDGYLDIPRTCEVYTPIGRWLERTQLVEVPQMFNVLFHGMSLIGNRPLPEENVRLLKKYAGWERRFDSPAGISGIAQVVGKLRLHPHERMALECAYSELYQRGNIVRCDVLILLYTAKFILTSNGLSRDEAFRLVGLEARNVTAASAVRSAM